MKTLDLVIKSIVIFLLLSCSAMNLNTNLKIIGGNKSSPGSLASQHTVLLVLNNETTCSGVIVSTEWVLTAAHCVQESEASELRIYFGSDKTASANNFIRASGIVTVVEDAFNYFPNFDLALVHLAGEIPKEFYAIQILDRTDLLDRNDDFISAGFGVVQQNCSGNFECSGILRESKTKLKTIFDHPHAFNLLVTQSQEPNTGGPCGGDSGGPLYYEHDGKTFLAGITNGLTLLHTPLGFADKKTHICSKGWGLYTSVSGYYDWIRETISKKSTDTSNHFIDAQGNPQHNINFDKTKWVNWVNLHDYGSDEWQSVEIIISNLIQMSQVKLEDTTRIILDEKYSSQIVQNVKSFGFKFNTQSKKPQKQLKTIAPLAAFSKLQTIALVGSKVVNFIPLLGLPELHRLSFGCYSGQNVFESTNLNFFIESLNFTSFELDLLECSVDNVDVTNWTNVDTLKVLNFFGSTFIDFSNIRLPASLKELAIKASSLSGILEVPSGIESLKIENSNLVGDQLFSFKWAKAAKLKSLIIRETILPTRSKNLPEEAPFLSVLILANTGIEYVEEIEKFDGLEKLDISGNAKIFELPKLPSSLKELYISGTNISPEDIQEAKKENPYLSVIY